MDTQVEISVVIPVYGCREALPELYRRLVDTLEKLCETFEIILVDDCCPQNSWEEIEQICKIDSRVIGIRMSRNFGQGRAITAGLDRVRGNWIVVMDCDLQDRPEGIADLYQKAWEGYDVVFAKRQDRKDSWLTKFLSGLFYKVFNYFTDDMNEESLCNFSISRRIVIDNFREIREQARDYALFIRWLGFKQTTIPLLADKRYSGESSYNMKRKIRLAGEIITAQSNKPLVFSVGIGFISAALSFFYMIFLAVRKLIFQDVLSGWTTVVASIYLMGGLLLCAIGVVGIYVGNIFNETKRRPLYVIQMVLNDTAKSEVGPH